mmetsp:Transcript_11011/g.26986  ORF Transcript_11011/g.26986 Transcript_11011/m.26986 type:complete len:253 (+) Transcript_11011:375-1133(+)
MRCASRRRCGSLWDRGTQTSSMLPTPSPTCERLRTTSSRLPRSCTTSPRSSSEARGSTLASALRRRNPGDGQQTRARCCKLRSLCTRRSTRCRTSQLQGSSCEGGPSMPLSQHRRTLRWLSGETSPLSSSRRQRWSRHRCRRLLCQLPRSFCAGRSPMTARRRPRWPTPSHPSRSSRHSPCATPWTSSSRHALPAREASAKSCRGGRLQSSRGTRGCFRRCVLSSPAWCTRSRLPSLSLRHLRGRRVKTSRC